MITRKSMLVVAMAALVSVGSGYSSQRLLDEYLIGNEPAVQTWEPDYMRTRQPTGFLPPEVPTTQPKTPYSSPLAPTRYPDIARRWW